MPNPHGASVCVKCLVETCRCAITSGGPFFEVIVTIGHGVSIGTSDENGGEALVATRGVV